MPRRHVHDSGSVHGQCSENLTPPPTLAPLDITQEGDDQRGRSKNHHIVPRNADQSDTPMRCGSSATGNPLQPLPLSPNANLRLPQSNPPYPDRNPNIELADTSDTSGQSGVNEGPALHSAPQLPMLTTVCFSGIGSSSRSAVDCSTPPPGVNTSATSINPSADNSVTAMHGVGGNTPSSSSPGRSMTLLERRNNRERSMMSISSPSGLNIETLQASMQTSVLTAAEAQKTTPPTHGWSKTVASAALLGDYKVPRTNSSGDVLERNSRGGDGLPSATLCASMARHAPAASPAFRRNSTSGCRRAGPALPLSGEFASGANAGSAMTPPVQRSTSAGLIPSKTVDSIPGAVKVASYNILASRLASTDLYPHCPPSVLSEEFRINLIKEEVRLMDPDILLLEEISVGVHEESLGPYLKSTLGLEGHHVVITDSNGQPRCSTRPPTTTCSTPSQKGLSNTRRRLDGLNLAALRGTSGTADTSVAPPSPSHTARWNGDHDHGRRSSGAVAAGPSGKSEASLPPLAGNNSGVTQPTAHRRSAAVTVVPTAAVQKDSPAAQQSRAQPSYSSMGVTMSTANTTLTASSNCVALQRSCSALEAEPAARTIAAAPSVPVVAATTSETEPQSPCKLSASKRPLTSTPLATPDTSAASVCAENHRRIEMDGVAIYYKANRFRVLEVMPVYFNAIAAAEDRLTHYEHQKLQVNSHNVALITVLHDTHTQGVQHVYIVAAVHLIWQRTNAQLWQAHQLLRIVEELKSRYNRPDVDLNVIAAKRYSIAMDSLSTQPPSLVESPLNREISGKPHVRREMPMPATPAQRRSISPQLTRAASNSTVESTSTPMVEGTGNSNTATSTEITDRLPWRRESIVSSSTTACGVLVTCIMGGDFNSERSGPVMEYLRTGRVPEGAQVMDYWKALTLPTSPRREEADTTTEERTETARTLCKRVGKDNEEMPSAPAIVAYSPPEYPYRVSAPQLDISTLPHHDSSCSSFSIGWPPSPAHPTMQTRRRTQSPPDTNDTDSVFFTNMVDSALPQLLPATPVEQRESPLFPVRVLNAAATVTVDSSASTPTQHTANMARSVPVRVKNVALACPLSAEESPYQLHLLDGFHSGRSAASLITSPVGSSLTEVTERNDSEVGNALPTVVVAPSARAMSATAATTQARSRNQNSQSSLSHSGCSYKTFKPCSPTTNDHMFVGSAGSASLHSRRRTSLEALRSAESSALIDFMQGNKSPSRSHSMSEYESVLSNPFGTTMCSMKLPQHVCHDTTSAASSDAGWASEEGPGQQQPQPQQSHQPLPPPQLPPPPQRHANTPGRVRRLTPTLESPPFNSPAENGTLVIPGKAEHRVKPLPTFSPAAFGARGDGGSVFGSLIHPQLFQMDNCEAPEPPRAGAKRRSVSNNAACTLSGTSTNGTCNTTPPASPQASRQRLTNAVGDTTGTTPSIVSVNHLRVQAEDELHLLRSSPASASSHEVPWPAVLEETMPCKPSKGLIDDVTHTIRFSDAYAPYCYRHPFRVSAVNPSTNMEGRVLDYILYEDEHVVCGAVLRLGNKQELPNASVPSDHYMIGAVLVPVQELHRT